MHNFTTYIFPQNDNSFIKDVSIINDVLHYHKNSLIIAIHKALPRNRGFLIERVASEKIDKLTHSQVAIILSYFSSEGLINSDGLVINKEPFYDWGQGVDFVHCEDNIILQLYLMKMFAKKATKSNHHIYAYDQNWAAYGYMLYDKVSNQYFYEVRELFQISCHLEKGYALFDAETLILKLQKLKKYCKRAGIYNLRISFNSWCLKEPLGLYQKIIEEMGFQIKSI